MTEYKDEDDDWVSKSQRKRECDDVQELSDKLVTISIDELTHIVMDDVLRSAIEEAHRIKSHGALKRQKHYIAKLMRSIEIEPISRQLQNILHKDDIHGAVFKRLERWRDSIIENGDKGIQNFLTEYPSADRLHLRQLLRNCKKEKENNKPPAAFRQIFKYIREVVDQSTENSENKF